MPISRIKTDGIQDDAITSAKIGVDVIVADDLAANSVTVSEITDGAVTSAKLDTNIAVTGTLSSGSSMTATGEFKANGGAVFNEDSADVDFRVESNGNANMLFVDGGNDRVGIGTSSPGQKLDVNGAVISTGAISAHLTNSASMSYDGSGEFSLRAYGATAGTGYMTFASGGGGGSGGTERMRIESSGNVKLTSPVNSTGYTEMLRLEGQTLANGWERGIAFTGNSGGLEVGRISSYLTGTERHLRFTSAGTLGMTIRETGKVGIGQINPDSESLLDLGSGENSGYTRKLLVTNTGNSRAGLGALSNIFRVFYADDQRVQFGTVSRDGAFTFDEKMQLDSNGSLLLGTTDEIIWTDASGEGIVLYRGEAFQVARNSDSCVQLNRQGTDGQIQAFAKSGTPVGSISVTGSATAYNTSSDHRLKENVTADWDATTRLKQLNPVRFNFIADADTTVDGFLAHEVQSVVPEAITGTHNEVDADGNPVYQGIDQSKLVPLLVKTIQELEARITALESN